MTEARARRRALPLLLLLSAGLVLIGALRWATLNLDGMDRFASVPTPAFIVLTVFVAIRITHGPMTWRDLGIAVPFKPFQHVALGLAGAAAIALAGEALNPLWLNVFGETRNLARFESASTIPGLLAFLALSWTFAAVGEEIAFRGVLMRGLTMALGGGAAPALIALLVQAAVFGLVHSYQGAAGIAATTVSGLIFGGVVLLARGTLWPAMLAHGFANTYGLVSLYLESG